MIKYKQEKVVSEMAGRGYWFRISTDDANDDAVAICYDAANAALLVEALNLLGKTADLSIPVSGK